MALTCVFIKHIASNNIPKTNVYKTACFALLTLFIFRFYQKGDRFLRLPGLFASFSVLACAVASA